MSEKPPEVPPGQPPTAPYPGAYPYPVQPPTHSKATTALVLGITGLVICPGVLSIPAWIIGQQAVRDIDAAQGTLGGRSQAQAGYVLGIVGTVYAALAILALVGLLVFSLVLTGTAVNELTSP